MVAHAAPELKIETSVVFVFDTRESLDGEDGDALRGMLRFAEIPACSFFVPPKTEAEENAFLSALSQTSFVRGPGGRFLRAPVVVAGKFAMDWFGTRFKEVFAGNAESGLPKVFLVKKGAIEFEVGVLSALGVVSEARASDAAGLASIGYAFGATLRFASVASWMSERAEEEQESKKERRVP